MDEKKEVQVPAKFADLVKKIEEMSVLDLAELVKILEEKFGVSAAAPMMMAAPAAGGANGAPAAEEQSSFTVVLAAPGDKKIEVIKAVKEITQKGLKEAKDLVDASASAPQVIKEAVEKKEADELKAKLEAAGAKVELK
ncbi:MAG TPA: 50S ribosomal protein L7/L12 [Candidatus Pacearchaeota archaeon]|jgi:large subunit ribosomal protein L7/L12|nr:50S ribosomal protein L7/L12 [Candidatus Pacearchaeota archaeon]